jgi:trigger factor
MIPGFEDGIVGMTAGEEKTLALTFPEDYHSEELKGAAVEFKVKLNSVTELQLAPLDEELFQSYGVEAGGEEQFRKEVGENMARELKNAVTAKVKQQVMDAVIEHHDALEVPRSLIAQETDALRQQMMQQFGGAAGAPDLDLKSLLPDDMFADNATRRVKLGLLLSEMISKFELTADADKVRETIEEMASTYEEPEEVINWYYSNQEQLASIESRVLEDQVVEKLLENANIVDKPCSYQDAIEQAQAQAG